ncbi:UNVERIFIED_CONTAM: hypothetical protein H355_001934 [Colinus virginianus]|nr:hypothetical protein H355_001934 [Colinus virginianus]
MANVGILMMYHEKGDVEDDCLWEKLYKIILEPGRMGRSFGAVAIKDELWNLLLLSSRHGEGSRTERGKVVNIIGQEGRQGKC